MDTTQQKATPWFDLLDLVQLCPGQVPAVDDGEEQRKPAKSKTKPKTKPKTVAITGNTRLLLFAFAHHMNGATDETWVARRTLRHETQMVINTLDTAISNLKRAGLIRIRKDFDDSKLTFRHVWIIQRERLKSFVGDKISEEVIANVVKAAIEDGQSSLRCSPARVEQAKTALWKAAGSTLLEIKGLPNIADIADIADKVTLRVSVGTTTNVQASDDDTDSTTDDAEEADEEDDAEEADDDDPDDSDALDEDETDDSAYVKPVSSLSAETLAMLNRTFTDEDAV